jgi:ornithine--oxo-acid transaminase
MDPMTGGIEDLVRRHRPEQYRLHGEVMNPQFVKLLKTIGYDRTWARASGANLYAEDGARYLDMFGGFGMFNVGRNNLRVREALMEALALELPGNVQIGISTLPAVLATQLLARAPKSLGRVLFCNSGTEAVEAAIKLGRAATGRTRVVSLENGFHGFTLGSLSASGKHEFTERFQPLLPGFARIPHNDLDALEAELRREDVALLIVEPIQGQGVNTPTDGYLDGAAAICKRYRTLFCADEVQTGLGRTGRMWASDHWHLKPDLMTVAKSLSGGYVPIGALLLSAEVFDRVYDSIEHAVSHGSTFAPNELGVAAGIATLRELDDKGLVERAERLGQVLREATQPLVERFDLVSEVRGFGLMWAMEFRATNGRHLVWRRLDGKRPGLYAQLVAVSLFREHKIVSQAAGIGINALKALPPLTIGEKDLDYFVDALERVLAKSEWMARTLVGMATRAARVGAR